MQTKTRVILNTAVMYVKAIITMLISLVTVPLILKALGHSDYGLYQLIGGVIAMLSFLNSSMTVSTQRFMSVSMGENDADKLNTIYNVGFVLHLLISVLILFLLEAFKPLIFSGFLNIESDRMFAAQIVYQILIISTILTVLSVPFNAALNAHENLTVFALIEIIDSLLRLLLAFVLIYSPIDRLVFYSIGMGIVAVVVFTMKFLYVRYKYKYLVLKPRRYFDKKQFSKMFGFAGWNTMGSMALIGRNQGISVVLNVFYGTIINAAYGIANQVNSLMNYLSQTLQQAINPQLMRSEGMKDRERMMRISYISCKYSVLIICLPAIPLIIEMPYVYKLWLNNIPPYSVVLTQLVLVLTIVSQYSSGIQSAIQSVGRVRSYYITVSLLLLLNVPLSYFILRAGYPPYYTVVCFIGVEIVTLITRLIFVKKYVGIEIKKYFFEVVFPTVITMVVSSVPAFFIYTTMTESFGRLVLVCSIYAISYVTLAWFLVLDTEQKKYLQSMIGKYILRK